MPGTGRREQFAKHGIAYRGGQARSPTSTGTLCPSLNAGTVELLDHPRLIAQLCGLERRTARAGREAIDHGPRGHDDLANAACGVLADLLVHAPGADGGAVPIIRGVVRMDLASWNQSGPAAFNTGPVDWSDLDWQDERNRRRYHLP